MSEKTDFHVDISKFPRGEFLFSTWGRKNSSEESNETSEEMNHAHVENKKYPRGDLRFPTWIFEKGGSRRYRSGRSGRSVSELSELSEVSELSERLSSPYSGLLVKGRCITYFCTFVLRHYYINR